MKLNNNTESISVIIPIFNHAGTIEECLFSIFKQTYRPLEVIVIDDGSTDNLKQILNDISKKNWFKSLNTKIIHQKNKGASSARNRGFGQSNGEYVIFWDADTIGRPEMLEKLKRQLDERGETSYAYSQFKFGWKKIKSQAFNASNLKKNNFIDTTSLIRRNALNDAVGPFDESLKRFQDWDLWLTLLKHNKTGIFLPEVLYTKIVRGRQGYSSWLPSFVYKLPWKSRRVQEYEKAKEIVLKKHLLFDC